LKFKNKLIEKLTAKKLTMMRSNMKIEEKSEEENESPKKIQEEDFFKKKSRFITLQQCYYDSLSVDKSV